MAAGREAGIPAAEKNENQMMQNAILQQKCGNMGIDVAAVFGNEEQNSYDEQDDEVPVLPIDPNLVQNHASCLLFVWYLQNRFLECSCYESSFD